MYVRLFYFSVGTETRQKKSNEKIKKKGKETKKKKKRNGKGKTVQRETSSLRCILKFMGRYNHRSRYVSHLCGDFPLLLEREPDASAKLETLNVFTGPLKQCSSVIIFRGIIRLDVYIDNPKGSCNNFMSARSFAVIRRWRFPRGFVLFRFLFPINKFK